MANKKISDFDPRNPTETGQFELIDDGANWRGNFGAWVRGILLTGLSVASSAAVAATDSVLVAIGKLQAQVSLKLNALNPTSSGTMTHSGMVDVLAPGGGQAQPSFRSFANNDGFSPSYKVGISFWHNRQSGFLDSTLVYGGNTNSTFEIGKHDGSSYVRQYKIDGGRHLLGPVTDNGADLMQVGGTARVAKENTALPVLGTSFSYGFGVTSDAGLWGLFFGNKNTTGESWIQSGRRDSESSYPLLLQPAGGNTVIGGNLLAGATSGSNHKILKNVSAGSTILDVQNNDYLTASFAAVGAGGYSGTASALYLGKSSTTNRSINAAGTINASGADYAEYERNNGATIAKGDIVGFDADGNLTLKFDDALSFGVKSTDPCMVGGDVWGTEAQVGKRPEQPQFVAPESADDLEAAQAEFDTVTMPAYEAALAEFEAKREAARKQVDRVAYSGKVPVNVQGAKPGEYIIATRTKSGGITGEPVAKPTFEQYQAAVGRVRRIEPDGRALIAVLVH